MAYSPIKEFDTRHISCTSALPKLNYKLSSTHVPPLICHMSNSVLCLGDTNLVLKIWGHLQSADINYGYRKTSVGGRQQFIIRDLAFSSLANHVTNSHRPPNSTPSATFHPSGAFILVYCRDCKCTLKCLLAFAFLVWKTEQNIYFMTYTCCLNGTAIPP